MEYDVDVRRGGEARRDAKSKRHEARRTRRVSARRGKERARVREFSEREARALTATLKAKMSGIEFTRRLSLSPTFSRHHSRSAMQTKRDMPMSSAACRAYKETSKMRARRAMSRVLPLIIIVHERRKMPHDKCRLMRL